MAKIERKYLAHFLELGENSFVRLGRDLESYAPELGAQVEKVRNILGETAVNLVGYEKTGAVESFFAEAEDPLFGKLQTILDEDLTLDACRCAVVEVKLWDGEGTAFPAIREEAVLEITSYGGDSKGYQIPFNIHYTGIKQKGTFDLQTKTFTQAES